MIIYKETKDFNKEDIIDLFKSVNWISSNYPDKLYIALLNSNTVITAYDNDKLVGLIRVIDDSSMVAFIHYLLVRPKYQGHGIAKNLVKKVIDKYKDFLYLEVMPEESKNAPFYEKLGFKKMEDGVAMKIANY